MTNNWIKQQIAKAPAISEDRTRNCDMEDTKQKCTRENLYIEIVGNAHVDDNGQPIMDDYSELTSNVHDTSKPYFCLGGCNGDFETWEEALEHLGKEER